MRVPGKKGREGLPVLIACLPPRVAALLPALLFSACTCGGPLGPACPTPNPTPTPIPTPTPAPTPTPPPADSSALLRIGPGLVLTDLHGKPVKWRQFIAYTVPGHPEIQSRWPAISTAAMDFFADYGANAFHMRLGPFIAPAQCSDPNPDNCGESVFWGDIGGGYNPDGSFNERFFAAIDAAVTYAEAHGWYVEVNIIDTWGCKHSQAGNPYSGWSGAALQACGRTAGDPTETAWVVKWVKLLTRHANVIWLLDNEGDNIQGSKQEWYDWLYNLIRANEGMNVHLIGANPTFLGSADYTYTHNVGPVSVIKGHWTLNNEHNPNHYDGGQEAANFAAADKQVGGVAYAFWQDGATDDQAMTALRGIHSYITGTAPVGCFAPDSEDPLWSAGSGQSDQAAMSAVKASEGAIGDRCGHVGPLPDDPSNAHGAQEESLSMLAADLRLSGYCASGPWGDALAILQSNGLWAEVHAIEFGGGCWTTGPQNYPKNLWQYNGTNPSPPPPACPQDVPTVTRVDCKMQQAFGLVDCTPKANGAPILPEGDPNRAACELKASGGSPTYSLRTDTGALSLQLTDNPWQVVVGGKGTGFLTCHIPASSVTMCNLPISK